jgi:putative exosortase-associated protein (TIGR04073 family)
MVPEMKGGSYMARSLSVLIIALLALSFTATAHADMDEVVSAMGAKLVRGVVNTFTGWVEFPAQIIKGYNEGFNGDEDNKIVGTVLGIFDGIGHSAGRTGTGLVDLFSFWAANPADNEGVGLPLDAEYAWEEGTPYNAFDPDIVEGGLKPVGRKLVRGVSNSLLGVAEVPGQIIKGVREDEPIMGVVKGVWYWFSRSAYGLGDIFTCILPNPEDQVGIAFDEEYPWDALITSME